MVSNDQLFSEVYALEKRNAKTPRFTPLFPSNLSLRAKKTKGNTRKRTLLAAGGPGYQQKTMTRVQAGGKANAGSSNSEGAAHAARAADVPEDRR